jgi:uncharacterized membrane protein YfcA
MNQYIFELILGLLAGLFSGMTGILPVGLLLIIFDFLKIGDYKSNLGAIALINLFPISIGSFWEFFKVDKINYSMGLILLASIVTGGYFGTKIVVNEKYNLSKKTIKYITSGLGFTIWILFLISAYYEKN